MDITTLQAGLVGNDALTRMILNHDNSTVFFNLGGGLFVLRTADATLSGSRTVFNQGDYELALAGNEASMTAAEFLLDTKQNGLAFLALNEREVWNETAVHGEKLSPDGTLLFRPLTDALDVLAGGTGILRTRIALPVTLSPIYDALVSNGKDNVLIAITGSTGNGIAILDLSGLALTHLLALWSRYWTQDVGSGRVRKAKPHVKKESSGWREVRESPNRRVNDAPKTRIA